MRPHVRRTTAVALILGTAATTAMYLATARAVDGHETELLEQQSAAAATVVASVVQQEQENLTAAARALGDADTGPTPAGTAQSGAAGLALMRQESGGLRVVARSGPLLAAIPTPGSLYHPAWASRVQDSLSYTGFLGDGRARVLGLALGFPDGEILYGELPIGRLNAQPASSSANAATDSPFAHLDFALYLGTSETRNALIMSSSSRLPLSGRRATVVLTGTPVASPPVVDAALGSIPPAPGQLFLVMSPRGLLGGSLDAIFPWAIITGNLAATLLVALFLEVTARRRDQAVALAGALADSERNFRQLFADNPQPMWAYDVETLRFLDVNEAALRKYGYSRAEFLAMSIADIRPAEDRERLMAGVRNPEQRPLASSGPWRHRLRDGRIIEVLITSHAQEFGGRPAVLVGVRDVTLERALEERMRHDALHDPLTGAANRTLLMSCLAELLASGSATRCALLLLDVAGMKTVNDSVGRDGADELLVAVCERITAAAGDTAHVARLGGDVFAVATATTLAGDDAGGWAERVGAALTEPFTVRQRRIEVSSRAGLVISEPGVDEHELLRRADVALAAAKEVRTNTRAAHVETFDAERDQMRREMLDLEADLRHAVGGGQLQLVYQPQLNLTSSRISGVEALIRWAHPQRGLLSPAVFLPIAERCGLMPAIDAWVVTEACAQARRWLDRGMSPVTVSVNICGHDIETGPALVDLVRRELERNRLPAHCLEVELTESVALRDREEAETVLAELRRLGVRVALDDFGTGYSMLDRVRDLPLDRVKIDRTFVRRAALDGASLLQAMVGMAHSLGLEVVAEGVETAKELKLLSDWGCDTIQGFLVSRPVAAANIETVMDVEIISRPRRGQRQPLPRPPLATADAGTAPRPPAASGRSRGRR